MNSNVSALVIGDGSIEGIRQGSIVFGNFLGQLQGEPTAKMCFLQTPSFTGLGGFVKHEDGKVIMYHPCEVSMTPRYGRLDKQNTKVSIQLPGEDNFYKCAARALLPGQTSPLRVSCRPEGQFLFFSGNCDVRCKQRIGGREPAEKLDMAFTPKYYVATCATKTTMDKLCLGETFQIVIKDSSVTFHIRSEKKVKRSSLRLEQHNAPRGPSNLYSAKPLAHYLKHVNTESTVGFSFAENGDVVFYERWRLMLIAKLTLNPLS